MQEIRSVLFVCTGNLCRSPMAEGILKDLAKKHGFPGLRVSSAGTWGLHGEGAADHAISVCCERGIDISDHVARRLTTEMIQDSDLVLGMELDHVVTVLDLCPEAINDARLLGQYGSEGNWIGEAIKDPYGRPKREYERCFERIEWHIKILFSDLLRGRREGSSKPQ